MLPHQKYESRSNKTIEKINKTFFMICSWRNLNIRTEILNHDLVILIHQFKVSTGSYINKSSKSLMNKLYYWSFQYLYKDWFNWSGLNVLSKLRNWTFQMSAKVIHIRYLNLLLLQRKFYIFTRQIKYLFTEFMDISNLMGVCGEGIQRILGWGESRK